MDYSYNNTPFFHPSAPFTTEPHNPPPSLAHFATAPAFTEPSQPTHTGPVEYHFHYHYPPPPLSYFDAMSAVKRVHWDDDVPRTPSPAFSSSSGTSSAGPITPETVYHGLPQVQSPYPPSQYGTYLSPQDPYAAKAYPAMVAASYPSAASPLSFSVHPMLSVAAHSHPNSQPFVWGVSMHPNQIRPRPSSSPSIAGYPIPPATLAFPATSPATAQLFITCALLPYEINVTPSKDYGQPFVTVGDVLREVYVQLRTQISHDEYARLCNVPHVKQSVDSAFYTRCAMLREGRKAEEQRGVRRSDLLMGSQMFAGLEMRSNNQAVLHVRPLA